MAPLLLLQIPASPFRDQPSTKKKKNGFYSTCLCNCNCSISIFSSRSFLLQINARSLSSLSHAQALHHWCDHRESIPPESRILRYRNKRCLYVTDFAKLEWCQKKAEFGLMGSSRNCCTKAMKAGTDRHKELEKEVVEGIKAKCISKEDEWATKLVQIIIGINQLCSKGLTRELRVIAFIRGVWITGFIDEIRLPDGENKKPVLVDFKTRKVNSQPFEPQQRNGRLQLMIYKLLWDHLVSVKFPSEKFFDFFQLNRNAVLSEEVRTSIADAGVPAQTLGDVVKHLENKCCMMLPADNKMILRYEWQKNKCLICEVEFEYEPVWLKAQLEDGLEFWVYGKEASCPPLEEQWKCQSCKYGPDSSKSSPIEILDN